MLPPACLGDPCLYRDTTGQSTLDKASRAQREEGKAGLGTGDKKREEAELGTQQRQTLGNGLPMGCGETSGREIGLGHDWATSFPVAGVISFMPPRKTNSSLPSLFLLVHHHPKVSDWTHLCQGAGEGTGLQERMGTLPG